MSLRTLMALVMMCLCVSAAKAQNAVEIFPQLGHASNVNDVAFSPDGKTIAAVSSDYTLSLWDVASGREIRNLMGDCRDMESVAYSPDGRYLAAGCVGEVKIWNTANWTELPPLKGRSGVISAVAFCPDNLHLVGAEFIGDLMIWNVATGQMENEFDPGSGHVEAVALSPDGKLFASVARKFVRLWDIRSGKMLFDLKGHTDEVQTVAFSRDGKTLVSGGEDKTVRFWDVATGSPGQVLDFQDNIGTVAFSPDGRTLLVSTYGGNLSFRDAATGRETAQAVHAEGMVWHVKYSATGKLLVGEFLDKSVTIGEASSGRELRKLRGHTAMQTAVAISHDNRLLASGDSNGNISLWDLQTGRALGRRNTPQPRSFWIKSIAFSQDDQTIASTGWNDAITFWNVADLTASKSIESQGELFESGALSPDGLIFAAGGARKTVGLWDIASGQLQRTLSGHANRVTAVAFSPKGNILASASSDSTIKIWDLKNGGAPRTFSGHKDGVLALAFSRDGTKLASGGRDHKVIVWDVAGGQPLTTITERGQLIFCVAFSPDGTTIAAGNRDNSLELWDTASGAHIRSFIGHSGTVTSLAFTSEGRTLVSTGNDGTIRLWDVATGRERAALVRFDDGSSIAITPEGYFDSSSAAAEQNINVRIGNRVFGIGSFRGDFYKPALVKASIAGQALEQFGSIPSKRLPPLVDLDELPASTNNPRIKVDVHLTDDGGGIGRVRLFLNGAAVIQDDVGGQTKRSYTVPLLNGANELSAVAFNADGSVLSNAASSLVTAQFPQSPPRLHAIVVGIQQFKNLDAQYQLTQSIGDAQLFAQTLANLSTPLFGPPDIKLLVTPEQTDKQHLIEAFRAMQPNIGPNDVFIFYFASHGEVSRGKYYLITSNVGSIENLGKDTLESSELAGLIANIAATKKLVVVDACHSQTLGDAIQQALASDGMNSETATTILSRGTGLTSLSASATNEEALEGLPQTGNHGLFTFALVNGLSGKPGTASNPRPRLEKDGTIDTFALADYIDAEVPILAKSLNSATAQDPAVDKSGAPFPVAKVP